MYTRTGFFTHRARTLLNDGWLTEIPPEVSFLLWEDARIEGFAGGTAIIDDPQVPAGLYGIVSGTITLADRMDRSLVLSAGCCEWVGQEYLFADAATVPVATAATDVECLHLPSGHLATLLEAQPELWRWLGVLHARNLRRWLAAASGRSPERFEE